MSLSERDQEHLAARGIGLAEAERQLERLSGQIGHICIDRPATVGDGIVRIDPTSVARLHQAHSAAADAGRCRKFVPASGAASRMFRDLERFRSGDRHGASWTDIQRQASEGDVSSAALQRFVQQLDTFAFHEEVADQVRTAGGDLSRLRRTGEYAPILEALLSADGLGYAARPKGQIPFHSSESGPRTPFEEHLREAIDHATDADRQARIEFTVSPEHRAGFEALLRRIEGDLHASSGVSFEVRFSTQKPSTDTLAIDTHGMPLRDSEGQLILRPGGHGALIENLNDLAGDIVFVKNIDNVQPEHRRQTTLEWKRTLAGYLVELQSAAHALLTDLRNEGAVHQLDLAEQFVRQQLFAPVAAAGDAVERRRLLIHRLDRPLRVCGVVRNTGEPGGGPFWVRQASGEIRLQIVETAEVDGNSGQQREVLAQATHFNPVDLVCGLRDERGQPYPLDRFVDPDTALITEKSAAGRDIRVLERPGLWNGAMAGWNTVFVEVPLETFSPVKTVLDLLRPEHQPRLSRS